MCQAVEQTADDKVTDNNAKIRDSYFYLVCEENPVGRTKFVAMVIGKEEEPAQAYVAVCNKVNTTNAATVLLVIHDLMKTSKLPRDKKDCSVCEELLSRALLL